MDIKYLDTFVKVTELKSFTLAAERLGLTQPGVSKQIQRLESELGTHVFRRTEGELALTDAGRAVYQSARALLTEWSSLQAHCRTYQGPVVGALSIGASTIPAKHFLPHILKSFTHAYPAVEVTVRVADSKDIEESLASGEIHMALIGHKPVSPALTARCIGSDQLVVVSPVNFPCQGDWTRAPFILRENGSGTLRAAQEALCSLGVLVDGLHCTVHASDTALILRLVQLGVGLAVLSNLDAQEAVAAGYAEIVHEFPEQRQFYLAEYRDYQCSAIQDAFSQMVYETLGLQTDAANP